MNANTLWAGYEIELPDANKWNLIRAHRDEILAKCDWTQMPDVPLSDGEKELWRLYRQELRNLPQAFTNPEDVIFPEPPF